MRKFLFPLLIFTTLLFPLDEDARRKFLLSYYGGDYRSAHSLLTEAYSDSTTVQIWEERLHLQHSISGCRFADFSTKGSRGMALLRMGQIDKAQTEFGEDGLSLFGKATLSLWKNDLEESRRYIARALEVNPEHPELLFFAGNIALRETEAIDYFLRFLSLQWDDPLKNSAAKQAIDFLEKVKGIELNVASLASTVESLDTKFEAGRLLIEGKIDAREQVRLLVDTGASGLSLEEKSRQPRIVSAFTMIGLGKNQIQDAQRVVFEEFRTGGFALQNAVAAISPDLYASGFDGIAGGVVFSDYLLALSLRAGEKMWIFRRSEDPAVAVLEKHGLRFNTQVSVPFYSVNKMIILKGRIRKSDEDMDILLDTGAQRSVLSTATAKRYTSIDYPRSIRMSDHPQLIGIGGRVRDLLLANNVEVQIGPLKKNFNEAVAINLAEINEAMDLEVDLILGQDFLEGYTLLIDYAGRTVTFLK